MYIFMRKSYFGNKLFSVDPDDLENKQLLRSPRRLELDSGDSDKLVSDLNYITSVHLLLSCDKPALKRLSVFMFTVELRLSDSHVTPLYSFIKRSRELEKLKPHLSP